MIEFKILKKSKKSNARLGVLKTQHGEVETPTLVPVATQGVIKTLTSEEVLQTKSQILIANTYHLHIRPGADVLKSAGGLHKFMNWPRPLMTDSGGFQVFSLGFGRDFGTGKILNPHTITSVSKNLREAQRSLDVGVKEKKGESIETGQQPKLLKITEDGVWFRSYVDGKKLFIGPKESVKIQELIGADIIFAFDECTSPLADYEYTKKSLNKTHNWAKICLKEHEFASRRTKQALFGIVQGGKFKDLRQKSAQFIGLLDFAGFGIGGEFGDDKSKMPQMLEWIFEELPENKPRHLLGIGHPEDLKTIIQAGVDTFDCIAPTHYARRGIAFTSTGKIDLNKSVFLKDKKPLDKNCSCLTCQNYSRGYIAHLIRAWEITPLKLITFHNLYFFNSLVEKYREDIKKDKI